jgi:hypothetical protein
MIDYEKAMLDAYRHLIRSVLEDVERDGLPGEHHFYIVFRTQHEGVRLSERLREQYPHEMTIVLQHQFRNLRVDKDRFQVQLTFGGIPEILVIPYEAISGFADPAASFGLQLASSGKMAGDDGETQAPGGAIAAMSGARTSSRGPDDASYSLSDKAPMDDEYSILHDDNMEDGDFEYIIDEEELERALEREAELFHSGKGHLHVVDGSAADEAEDRGASALKSAGDKAPGDGDGEEEMTPDDSANNIVSLDAFRKKS